MSDVLRLLVIFLIVINPAGGLVLWGNLTDGFTGQARRVGLLSAVLLAFAFFWVAVLLGPDLLDILQISNASYEIAAGSLLVLGGLFNLARFNPFERTLPVDTEHPLPVAAAWLAFWLASPAALGAAIWYGIDYGRGDTLLAITVALAVVIILIGGVRLHQATLHYVIAREIGRLIAGLSVVIGFGLIVAGVLDV